ncbi:Conserved hypothetical protein 95 [Parapedobacter composti]|uniref:Uncharacterized protein n=2 Tax=Parapedobacter composti TaxID=623281 RepID=A0A1I1L2I1_9SPHI|nr:Conserved hypothetical protein 95 [Parapedobacter composti]
MTAMNPRILTMEVQHYLREQEQTVPADMALRRSPFPGVSAAELAQQLDGRQRCRLKLPLWYETPCIYYPGKLSIEQASSHITAAYKASLIPHGSRMADLTGGFGADAYFFSRHATSVVHCEKQQVLSQIAQHNAAALAADNITFVATDGLAYLLDQPADTFDCVYIDPSRRVQQRKVFRLEDCEPNVVKYQAQLLEKAEKVIIKAAPLLDISMALEALPNISEVHVVSTGNECKELLLVAERTPAPAPRIVAAMADGVQPHIFPFHLAEEKAAVPQFGLPERYLYEPDAALLKAGAFKLTAQRYGLKKLHQHTHLYTSAEAIPQFMGRRFYVDNIQYYADFKRDKKTVRGNVSTRNFPLKPEELRKKHRIQESGDAYLFFCKGMNDSLLVIFASKC